MDNFKQYLENFDYQERKEMKIDTQTMLKLFKEKKVQIIDIRFKEEHEAWSIGFVKHIPLPELPNRLNELDKDKIIVTICPHYDRAEIARLFLTLNGFKSKYLTDGMLGMVDFLRGDKAKDFIDALR